MMTIMDDVYMSVAKAGVYLGKDGSHEFLLNLPRRLVSMIVKRYVGKQCFLISFTTKACFQWVFTSSSWFPFRYSSLLRPFF